MRLFDVATVFILLLLVGVEFSVSAFVNPAAWRLDPQPQLQMLGRFAVVMGKLMPVWYTVCAVLLAIQSWLHWQTAGLVALLCSGCAMASCHGWRDLLSRPAK